MRGAPSVRGCGDPDLPSVWVWPSSVPSRELGRPELREVFGVVPLQEHRHHDIDQHEQGVDQREGCPRLPRRVA